VCCHSQSKLGGAVKFDRRKKQIKWRTVLYQDSPPSNMDICSPLSHNNNIQTPSLRETRHVFDRPAPFLRHVLSFWCFYVNRCHQQIIRRITLKKSWLLFKIKSSRKFHYD
jgi:hypothetical protein